MPMTTVGRAAAVLWLAASLPALCAGGAACPASGCARREARGVTLIQHEHRFQRSQTEVQEDLGEIGTAASREDDADDSAQAQSTEQQQGMQVSAKKCAAEFVAMTLFVFFGCGSAMSVAKEPGWVMQVSLTFGLAITVLAYTIGHYSGGQINCAVSFGLMLYGALPISQGICNILAQMLGAVTGAAILKVAYPAEKDLTGGLGTNGVSEGWSKVGALVAEFVGTFLLMYVVFETAVNPAAKSNAMVAPLAIGLAVFLAHSVMIPIDGCSINPTRSFGPALVQSMAGKGPNEPFKDMWVFWVGPLAGAAAAAGLYTLMTTA